MRLKGKRVVVKALLPSDKIGSIYIPDSAKQQPLMGTVELVGDKCGDDVKPGDTVLFGRNSWSRFNGGGYSFPHMLLKEEDVMAVIE